MLLMLPIAVVSLKYLRAALLRRRRCYAAAFHADDLP